MVTVTDLREGLNGKQQSQKPSSVEPDTYTFVPEAKNNENRWTVSQRLYVKCTNT